MIDGYDVDWSHQDREVALYTFAPGRFLFWDPRTGKTRPIVREIAHWIAEAGVRRILVVAPVDGCRVWLKRDELGRFAPDRVRIVDLSGDLSIADRALLLGALDSVLPTVVVVNRDVIFRERTVKRGDRYGQFSGLCRALLKWGVEALVLDECQDYRNVGSARHRAAESLAKRTRFRRGLSGTPDPRDYIDYYGQFKIIAPEVFGTRKDAFIERYCAMHPIFPRKVKYYINEVELREKIFSVASRVEQKDCYDMPEVLPDQFIDVPFTRMARELYDEIAKEFVADFLGLKLDGTHQLARLAMLHQLAQGFVRGEDEPEWVFDGKIKAAHRYLDEMMRADKRVIVYHKYRPEGDRLEAELTKKYGAAVGRRTNKNRSAEPFVDAPAMRIYIAQEETGISWSGKQSDHVLWYSWGPKADTNRQCRDRIFADRSEKPHGLSYTFLRVPRTNDDFMTVTYKTKQTQSDLLLKWGPQWAAHGVDFAFD